jgi:hypothetical protein
VLDQNPFPQPWHWILISLDAFLGAPRITSVNLRAQSHWGSSSRFNADQIVYNVPILVSSTRNVRQLYPPHLIPPEG